MVRESTRRQLLASVGTASAVALAGCGGGGGIGGGSGNKNWYFAETDKQLSKEFVSMINTKDQKNIELRKGGSDADALKRLNSGKGEFAIVGGDVASFAMQGAGLKAINSKLTQLSGIMSLYPMPVTVVARSDIDAETVGDLSDATVNIGPPDSRLATNARQILPKSGASFSMANVAQADAITKVANGSLDATFAIGDWPIPAVQEAAPDVKLLSLSDEVRSQVVTSADWFVEAQLPAGVYEGIDYMVPTVGIMAVLVTHRQVNSGLVTIVTDRLITASTNGDVKTRASYLPTTEDLDEAKKGIPRQLNLHDGAKDVLVFTG